MIMKRRNFIYTAGSLSVPLMLSGCSSLRMAKNGQSIVSTPEKRAAYLDEMLRKMCTETGPRPVGSPAFDKGAKIIYHEMKRSLKFVEKDEFTFENWVVNGPFSLEIGGEKIPCLPGELSESTPGDGFSGILVSSDDKRRPFAIKKNRDSEPLAYIAFCSDEGLKTYAYQMAKNPSMAIVMEKNRALLEKAVRNSSPARYISPIKFIPDTPTRNIVGTIPGKTDEEVIFLAHIDSVFAGEGANDNTASAILMLMLAHSLAGTTPKQTIRFVATAGHEIGFLGSTHYMERRKKEGTLGKIKDSFCIDSVTWGPDIVFVTKDTAIHDALRRIDKEKNIPGTPKCVKEESAFLDNQPYKDTSVNCIYVGSEGYKHFNRVHHTAADTPDSVPKDTVEIAFLLLDTYLRETGGI